MFIIHVSNSRRESEREIEREREWERMSERERERIKERESKNAIVKIVKKKKNSLQLFLGTRIISDLV